MSGEIELTRLSIPELESLKEEIDATIMDKREAVKDRLLSDLAKKAEKEGIALSDLIGKKGIKKRRAKALYQNPTNLTQTWSGKGRKPKWITELESQGKSLDSMKIAD